MTVTEGLVELLHECNPPACDVEHPGRRVWYCPECGSKWWFVQRMFGRRVVGGEWRVVSNTQPRITEVGARELWLAMGEGPNYSPSWSELIERATALRNRCQELEENET